MPLIIDGHNLIPKVRGLSLEIIDDEIQLVELLQEYCQRSRKKVEVYFDNAPPGQPRARSFGNVTARFVRAGRSADQAIQEKLARLGNEARNWTVVSSDREVQAAARASRAGVLSSEAFAGQLQATLAKPPDRPSDAGEGLSSEELDDWLKLFGEEEQ
jgi:predicted RNA-binding protein with PIN domain